MGAEVQTTSVGSGGEIVRRGPPRGLSRLTAYATGREILILGPGSAGKTKFAEYLRSGALDPEGRREMTYRVTESPTFVVQVGQERPLVLKVRRTVDTPGQVGPIQHANLAGRRKPHALIILLDCTKTVSTSVQWLRLLCDRLDTVLRKTPSAKRRLSQVIVLLNKRDKVGARKPDQLRQGVREVLNQHLSVVLGAARVDSIPILDCISVRTEEGTALIDEVIRELAGRLAGR
jgi:signal recognition particle receptor subunit beta